METLYNVSAKNITTYGGNGIVKEILLPETFEEVQELWANHDNISILGGGSNTIILDGVINDKVVSFKKLDSIEIDGNIVRVGAGARLHRVVHKARECALGGLEFMMGVPASIGGLVKMNASAFGHEIGVYVDKIIALNHDFEICEYFAPFDFGYRRGFQGVVLQVDLRLDTMEREQSVAKENQYRAIRRLHQPVGRSAGSVFKNPSKSAGYYIDKVGLKGTRIGGAQISTLHGNFIINTNDGSADDYLQLVALAKGRVHEEFGILLQEEFVLIGEI